MGTLWVYREIICFSDVYVLVYSHAFMKTDPYCCTPNYEAENCDNAVCDTDGNCHHE